MHHRKIPVTENYTLTNLYPNTLYYVWLAARGQRGEGTTTIPLPVRTKQYGKQKPAERPGRASPIPSEGGPGHPPATAGRRTKSHEDRQAPSLLLL
jgi:hypothetical protein